MANVCVISEKNEWRTCLYNHSISDVYFQYEYVKPMADHLDSTPILIEYSGNKGGFLYCLLVMDIANDIKFKNLIPKCTYYDAETPYGYGGPCFYGEMEFDEKSKKKCQELIKDELNKLGVISQFIRFHPLMFKEGKSTIITDKYGTYKNTVCIDLTDEETVISNLDSQYRRKIRKAKETGVSIEHDKGNQIEDFIKLYDMTMRMHKAEDMYFFGKDYYDTLIDDFSDNFEIFYARIGGRIVGASIFLFDNKYMHFHLGGRDIAAPKVPFENMLMVEAAKWGAKKGLKKLHIGGGLSDEDSLFQYKKKFNRSGILPFYIGRFIFNENRYSELMNIRISADRQFDPNNKFYIQYRF